jgi:hypothetical protein
MPRHVISNLLGLVGAIAGGALGFWVFRWLLGQGFYGLMIPGAMLGLGCSLLARHDSRIRGVLCGIAAFILALFADWYYTITDDSFVDFVRQGKSFQGVTLLMTAVGALIAFWVGKDGGLPGYPRKTPGINRPAQSPESRRAD